jgi:hypothetical protein
MKRSWLLLFVPLLLLAACDSVDGDTSSFPKSEEERRRDRLGKLGGDDGFLSIGGEKSKDAEGANPLGVNSFLWRATLDTISFMPLASADPFGGVILTDWYEDPSARGQRYKINAMILDRQLRADSVRISVFKQKTAPGGWSDLPNDPALARKLEDTVLTRARQLRVQQLGY